MDCDSIDDLLSEIDELQAEMISLQLHKNTLDAYFISLLFLVILNWVRCDGLKRIIQSEASGFHYTDIMMISYVNLVVV